MGIGRLRWVRLENLWIYLGGPFGPKFVARFIGVKRL